MNKSTKYSKVLFILHMPPPVHGASMVGKYIHDSKIINNAFECHYLNLALAKDLDDIGKGGIRKLKEFYKQLKQGEFYQFNLSSCIRQQNSLTAQFVSFSLSNLANIFYPPQFLQ